MLCYVVIEHIATPFQNRFRQQIQAFPQEVLILLTL